MREEVPDLPETMDGPPRGSGAEGRRRGSGLLGCAALVVLALVTGCGGGKTAPPALVPGGDPDRGQELATVYGCASCHVIPGVPGARGNVGPPLTDVGQRRIIAGTLPNSSENLQLWIRDPQGVDPGNAMPNMGVTERDARDLAAYLMTLR